MAKKKESIYLICIKMNYKTSKNYTHLRELLDKGMNVVCFVTWDYNMFDHYKPDATPRFVTDVCMANHTDPESERWERYSFGCRGLCFCQYWVRDEDEMSFEDFCKINRIEYIEPNKEVI